MIDGIRVEALLLLLVFVGGCIGGASGYCADVTDKLKEKGRQCQCEPIDQLQGTGNQAEPLCRCTCQLENGSSVTVDVGRSK